MRAKSLSIYSLALCWFLSVGLRAQTVGDYDGDGLARFLNKSATSTEILDLKSYYKFQMANESHYFSKDGIELVIKQQLLNEIHLYYKSAVYGSFMGKLPKKLKFAMQPSDVRNLLGKPDVSYSSGYCEYDYSGFIISCWFDAGRLTQVTLSAKTDK